MKLLVSPSNLTPGVDLAFWVIFGISLFFLVGLTSFIMFIVFRYRKEKHPKAVQIKENMKLEITWTIVPVIIVLFMFYIGYKGFLPMLRAPKDAIEVETVARKWDWNFIYKNGKESTELYVPINKAVRLNMRSLDVIHGLFIPAYKIKQDVVPGYTTMLWFIPQEQGDYDIYCSYYCGLNHSFMGSKVHVVPEDSFNRWLAHLPPKVDTAISKGLTLIKNNGCTGCHSMDGTVLLGPSFKGLFGDQRTIERDGKEKKVTVDESYIKTALYEPATDIPKGFQKGVMQSYKNKLTIDDVKNISDYLKSIGKK